MSLTIANLALDYLGASPLASLRPSQGPNVQRVERHIDRAVKHVLRRVQWSEETLTVCPDEYKVGDPCCDLPGTFCHAFVLPSDLVSVYDVELILKHHGHGSDVHWAVRKVNTANGKKKALLTDCAPVRLVYVCKPSDLDALENDVCDLIALQLALRLAPSVKADKALKRELRDEFARLLDDAAMVSGGQDAERLHIPNGFLLGPRVGSHNVLAGPGYHRHKAGSDDAGGFNPWGTNKDAL